MSPSSPTAHTQLRLILLASAMFQGGRMLIGATSALYLVSKGLPEHQVFLLKGMQAGIILLLEIPFGMWADRHGKRGPVVVAMLLGGGWLALTAAAWSVPILFVAEALNAISLAMAAGALDAVYLEKAKASHRSVQNALATSAKVQFRAMALAAGVGGIIYGLSADGLWWLSAVMVWLSIIPFWWGTSTSTESKQTQPTEQTHGQSSARTRNARMSALIKAALSSHRGLISALLASGFLYAGFQIAIQYWQLILVHTGLEKADTIGSATLFGLIFVVILLVQSAVIPQHLPPQRPAFYLAVLLPPALWCGAAYTGITVLTVAATCLYFWLYRSADVVVGTIINEGIDDTVRATVISTRSTLARAITLASTPIVTAAVNAADPAAALLVTTGLSLGAAAAMYWRQRHPSI